LDDATPFSAARARNEGIHWLLEQHPELEYVQFVDGDSELNPAWIDTALQALGESPDLSIVCGRVRERFPDASIYNTLCDIEWDTPVGDVASCGGIFLVRAVAFSELGGFDPQIIAGEEPELCLRMRRHGWRIRKIAADMAQHDAAMHDFREWWSRAVRAGHAYAQGVALHGRSSNRFCVRENCSIAFWAAVIPLIAVALSSGTDSGSLVVFAAYPLQIIRVAVRQMRWDRPPRVAWIFALFCMLAKWPQHLGQWRYISTRVRGRQPKGIEHRR
jgi:GT2 family glycosyltransferase